MFTEDLDTAMWFAKEVDSGDIHINWETQCRAGLMPCGLLSESGFGKEGPNDAVQEITKTKTVGEHLPMSVATHEFRRALGAPGSRLPSDQHGLRRGEDCRSARVSL